MKKFIVILISFFLIVGCSSEGVPTAKKESVVSDGITFKNEYENLNATQKDDFNISKENAFKYLKRDIIEQVFSETNIVFIGNAYDINSRVIVNILDIISKDYDIKNIYYLDSLKNFAKYEINVNGQVKSQEESKLYNLVFSYVKNYDDSLEKLSSPSIVFIKDGKVIDYYIISNDLDDNAIDTNNIKENIISFIEKLDV